MSSVSKGNIAIKTALRTLRKMGYKAAEVERKGKNIRGPRDLFGLFDIVAYHPYRKPLLLQVTTQRPHPHQQYKDFAEWGQGMFDVQQWVRIPGRPETWRLIFYYGEEYMNDIRCPLSRENGLNFINTEKEVLK